MKTISFVIATYQNEKAITETYKKITALYSSELSQFDYELIYVDDGSTDYSVQEIKGLREHNPRVKLISFTRNFGQMAAILAGFKHARGDAIINISANLQDPVELIPQMVQQWESDNEIVICFSTNRNARLFSKPFSALAHSILRLSAPKIPRGGFDFVLMSRKVMDTLNEIDVRNRFFQGDLFWTGYQTSYIPYTRLKRTIGKSQSTFGKRVKTLIDAILDTSYLPIRLISGLGFLTSITGFVYMLTVFGRWFFESTPLKTWAPVMMAVLIMGGLLMIMLGIIGEYVWRIYDEVRKKPNYIIEEKQL